MTLAAGTPIAALMLAAGYVWYLRRGAGPAQGAVRAGMSLLYRGTVLGRVSAVMAGIRPAGPTGA